MWGFPAEEWAPSQSAYRVLKGNKVEKIDSKEVATLTIVQLETLSDQALKQIETHIKTAHTLKHKNCAQLLASFATENQLWIIQPLLVGNMQGIIHNYKPRGFDEPITIAVLRSVVRGLEYLHENGIMHRCIRCASLLLTYAGEIQITDFGASGMLFEHGERRNQRHTFPQPNSPCWLAPEVLEQSNGYDAAVDIWSLGVTGIELATGKPPLADEPPMMVMLHVIERGPPELEGAFPSLRHIVDACLRKDPKDRMSASQLNKLAVLSSMTDDDSQKLLLKIVEDLPTQEALSESLTAPRIGGESLLDGHASRYPLNEASLEVGEKSDNIVPPPGESRHDTISVGDRDLSATPEDASTVPKPLVNRVAHPRCGTTPDCGSPSQQSKLVNRPGSTLAGNKPDVTQARMPRQLSSWPSALSRADETLTADSSRLRSVSDFEAPAFHSLLRSASAYDAQCRSASASEDGIQELEKTLRGRFVITKEVVARGRESGGWAHGCSTQMSRAAEALEKLRESASELLLHGTPGGTAGAFSRSVLDSARAHLEAENVHLREHNLALRMALENL